MWVIKFILRRASGDVVRQKSRIFKRKEVAEKVCLQLNNQQTWRGSDTRTDLYWVEELKQS